MSLIRNLTTNALKPGFLPVMLGKALGRLNLGRNRAALAARDWCARLADSPEPFATALDASLWTEAVEFDTASQRRAREKLGAIDLDLGGGADCRLLYFLTRLLRPEHVVETGVAAGHSTVAILSAMRANRIGHLWSSDFPYFRLHEPEKYVGILVDEALKERWTLYLDGDRRNLERIAGTVPHVDLLHYDSDKSSGGRATALRLLQPRLDERSVVVMDDIQDNLFFRRYVEARTRPWRVFGYATKFVGLVGR
jgi:predicted O-methyltransferase YrrM